MPPPVSGRLRYQPALDGVRALAVLLVLLFHGGVSWMPGGYVGVSVFFTLSGFLITSLLLQEHGEAGRIGIAAFYLRRVKRLWPASMACLLGVVVAAGLGAFGGVPHLRADVWGAVGQVLNWVKLAQGTSYQDLVAAKVGALGPLDHYWSLAIEEQFYWLWPVALAALLPRLAGRRAHATALTALAAGFIAVPFVVHASFGPDATYWATPARLGEILAGAALAAVVRVVRPKPWWAILTLPSLAVILWAAVTWPPGSGPAYRGWLGVFALASVGLVAGLQVRSPLRAALSWPPLVGLGLISYGVYLYHWPVYALLDGDGVRGAALLTLRLTATVSLAVLSYVLLERPVRAGTFPPRLVGAGALTAGAVLAALVFVVPQAAPFRRSATADELAQAAITPHRSLPPLVVSPGVDGALPRLSRPMRILVVGDSTAMALGDGLVPWANDHPEVAEVSIRAAIGCGLIRSGEVATDHGPGPFQAGCERSLATVPSELERLRPDVVVVMVTVRDLEDRVWEEDEGVLSPRDDRFAERLHADYARFASDVHAAGVPHVAWVLAPMPHVAWHGALAPLGDPRRYEAYHSVIRRVANEMPDVVVTVDLARWVEARDARDGVSALRPDNLHLSKEAAYQVVDSFLTPELLGIVTRPLQRDTASTDGENSPAARSDA